MTPTEQDLERARQTIRELHVDDFDHEANAASIASLISQVRAETLDTALTDLRESKRLAVLDAHSEQTAALISIHYDEATSAIQALISRDKGAQIAIASLEEKEIIEQLARQELISQVRNETLDAALIKLAKLENDYASRTGQKTQTEVGRIIGVQDAMLEIQHLKQEDKEHE